MRALLLGGPRSGDVVDVEPLEELVFRLTTGEKILYRYHSTEGAERRYLFAGVVFELRQDVTEI